MAGQKTDDRDVQLGQRIAERRKRSKLTQRKVADRFGMSAAQLQKYEKGVNRISAIHLAILSRMTGVPVSDFLDGIPRIDEEPGPGFHDVTQVDYAANDPWVGLARVVAQHVSERFTETGRREFTAAIDVLRRELEP